MPATKHPPRPSRRRKPLASPIAAVRKKYMIQQSLLARLLDVSLRTASALEAGTVSLGRVERRFTELKRLCDALSEVGKPAYVGQWLQLPNEMLGDLKPVEAIERGQSDLVWQVVEGLRHGSQL